MPTSDSRQRASAWQALEAHATEAQGPASGGSRIHGGESASALYEACGLVLDTSRQGLDTGCMARLFDLASACDLDGWRRAMFHGEVVNTSEERAALHVALRWPADGPPPPGEQGEAVLAQVEEVRVRMAQFSTSVRDGSWLGFDGEPIEHVVNIGIGGSDLGPAMVCRALEHLGHERMSCHFVSNLDSNHLLTVLAQCVPGRTLFIIASKTFSTEETLTNAGSARRWLVEAAGGDEAAVARHFVAVSTALDRCASFGIPQANVFGFWDWVGGRYSLWSAIGLSIAIYLGMEAFRALQAGAHAMDRHFLEAPPGDNLPVLLALIGIWNRNLRGLQTLAVLPYDHCLELFPAFLQQLEMESNGKGVDRAGRALTRPAAPVIWGALGNNGQHAFYQLLHQGVDTIALDVLVAARSQQPLPDHQEAVLANALAQVEAFASGRNEDDAREALAARGMDSDSARALVPHLVIPGGRPVSVILYDRLDPATLGALIALYEHKVFVQAVCWDINPFDQFGVELGKELARSLKPLIVSAADGPPAGESPAAAHDDVTRRLVARLRQMRDQVRGAS